MLLSTETSILGISVVSKKRRYLWKVWANSLGVKARAEDDSFSDHVAIARTIILLVYVITNVVIVAGNVRHW